jgi:PAS domain-containing protein/HPt (histidine-containing phosphotransfer) domain-containing protein
MKTSCADQKRFSGTIWSWLTTVSLWLVLGQFGFSQDFPARNGHIDLSHWQPTRDGNVSLAGEWLYTWNEFKKPSDVVKSLTKKNSTNEWRTVSLPGSLQNMDRTTAAPSPSMLGHGTYVLRLSGLKVGQELRIAELRSYSSARIYAFPATTTENPQPWVTLGHPGPTKATSRPEMHFQSTHFPALKIEETGDYLLVIHIANYHYSWGGIWVPPTIGEANTVALLHDDKLRRGFLVLGALAIIMLYNLSLFFQRREDRASLMLAVFSLLILVREIAVDHPYLLSTTADAIRFEWRWKLTFLTIVWPATVYLTFLLFSFKRIVNRSLHRLIAVCSLFCTVVIAAFPATIYASYLWLAQTLVGITTLYCLWCLIQAVRAAEPAARISLIGSLILGIAVLNDVAATRGWTPFPENTISFGVIAFILFQSQIVGIRFAHAFNRAEHLGQKLQEEVKRQTRDIRSILESIHQGIFTIQADDLRVGDDYSTHLHSILESEHIAGYNVFALFFDQTDLDDNDKDQIRTTLEFVMGEDELVFASNDHCLPTELRLLDKQGQVKRLLELDWSPIVNQANETDKVLVCIRDVTKLKALESEATQNREELAVISQILKIEASRFQRFLQQAFELVEDNRHIVHEKILNRQDCLRSLYVNLHTLKGMSRTYHLDRLTNCVHQAEQYYAQLMQNEAPLDQQRLIRELDQVYEIVSYYLDLHQNKLGRRDDWDYISIPHQEWQQIARSIHQLTTAQSLAEGRRLAQQCAEHIDRYFLVAADEVLKDALAGVDSLAAELGKHPPRLLLNTNHCGMTREGAELMQKVITHLLRNSLDHGIEPPEERQAQNKNLAGEINILLAEHENGLMIKFRDDGRGLDLAKIRQRALNRGLLSTASRVDAEQLAQLIFESGFSTKDQVSRISGRGVGMDAVRRYIEEAGGSIAIRLLTDVTAATSHCPFEIRLMIPTGMFGQYKAVS